MKKYLFFCTTILLLSAFDAMAQNFLSKEDSLAIYGDRADSLDAAIFISRQDGTYLSRVKEIRTEVISAAGLCKMACCNLAESFENSASVTVGYSDAVTGARQIKLLGLSGIYTQMLDENRPVMRGISAPWGLGYVPGQWLESIQIAKGATSVINGVESLTGQINLEHRKPTDEKPLFINYAAMADSKMDLNVASSLQLNDNWSTVLLGHVSGNFLAHDMNSDGFMDEPMQNQLNFANRWLYFADSGAQVRFGVRALRDTRLGGSIATGAPDAWNSHITNDNMNAYVKVGIPLDDDNNSNIAFVGDYTFQRMNSDFGDLLRFGSLFNTYSHSAFANLLYQNEVSENYKFTLGASTTFDRIYENLDRFYKLNAYESSLNQFEARAFMENTVHFLDDKMSTILGLSLNYYSGNGLKFAPRVTFKYSPIDEIVIRANGGRGLRFSNPLVDNIGVFSTGKLFDMSSSEGFFKQSHLLEDAWTLGGNVTYYLPWGASSNCYLSLDYFHTGFTQQMVVDYDCERGVVNPALCNTIAFYPLDGHRSFTDTYQLDFSIEPVERFTVTLTGRYTNAQMEYRNRPLAEKPMTSRYKAVVNLQYSTNLNKWIFDFTTSANGPCKVYDFMLEAKDAEGNLLYPKGTTPTYPLLYFQVTRRFKGLDIYAGGENLTGYRQHNLLLGPTAADGKVDPFSPSFDASAVWGPIMGAKFYAGLRFTLWKTVRG